MASDKGNQVSIGDLPVPDNAPFRHLPEADVIGPKFMVWQFGNSLEKFPRGSVARMNGPAQIETDQRPF
jgi:hypothetical protein